MSKSKQDGNLHRSSQLGRRSKNTFVTKSGQTIKINRTLKDRVKSARDSHAQIRAERLSGMPKSRFRRSLYRLHPKRLYKYWFSREGAIMGLKIIGVGIIAGFILLFGIFAYFRKDLPNLKDISGNNLGGSIRYYDRTGQTLLWEDYDAVKRIPVQDQEISQNMKDATVAIEDKGFFQHGGFDVRGIVRAGVNDTFGSGGTQGGSTITQQLVKLTQNWTRDRTLTRKAKELILSVELEREYSKQQILTGYLNAAPYGGIEYGVEAASQDYFQKSAKDLTIDEAALLAAVPKSPTFYSPYTPNFATGPNKRELISRQRYIIDLMGQQHMITADKVASAKKIDTLAKIRPRTSKFNNIKAPWFVLTAKEQLESKYTNSTYNRGGWRVTTTLDMNMQGIAEEQVQKGLLQVRRQGGDTAAFVAEDVKTGQVVALVGGADFNDTDHGQNNYASDYRLPPGSSIKPYDYSALIDNSTNAGAGSVLYDSKGPIGAGYPCTHPNLLPPDPNADCAYDYSRSFPGPVTLRYAIGGSRNVPAIKAMTITGVDKTLGVADKLMNNPAGYQCYGDERLTIPNQCGTSAAIGDGAYLRLTDHVNGYSSLARNGLSLPQSFILKIEDGSTKVVDQWKLDKGTQAVRADAAYIVGDMMSDPNASYFSPGNKPQRFTSSLGTWKFGVKTGTTNDNKDGWMMGFSSQYAAGVWVGYHNRQQVMSGAMENMTQPIWQGWMRAIHTSIKPEDIPRPPTVQTLPAFVIRSHVGYGSVEPSPVTDLFPSWYKSPAKATGGTQTIDIISNKLATDCTPARARKTASGSSDSNTFSIDPFVKGGLAAASTVTDKDDVHVCGEAKPTIAITGSPSTCNGTCSLTVNVTQGAHPLSSDQHRGTINIMIAGQIVQSYNIDNPDGNLALNFNYPGNGAQEVTAQIIDSVLYDASSGPVTITFNVDKPAAGGTAPTSPLTLNPPVADADTKVINFSWTYTGSDTPTVAVYKKSEPNIALCQMKGTNSCSVPYALIPSGTEVFARDSADHQSNYVTVQY
ncbi:MAG: hypothetical protein NVS1B7_3770 [Candidatus Saccharimonadales bacterium]